MWISVKNTIIEEQELSVNDTVCASGRVLMRLTRVDVWASIFLIPKKKIEVFCLDTHKKVKVSQWSPEIKAKARAMKSNLKVPQWGYWSLGALVLAALIIIPMGFYNELKQLNDPNKPYLTMSTSEKLEALKALDTGDLIATTAKVYMISSINENTLTLTESVKPAKSKNYSAGLTNEEYVKSSFTGKTFSLTKQDFYKGTYAELGVIVAVLDN